MQPKTELKDGNLEAARRAALAEYAILDTPPEADFDDLVRLATEVAGVPAGGISFVDAHRVWFKARIGLPQAELPREASLCTHALAAGELLIIHDLAADPAWAGHPAASGSEGWRFYAGVPLRTPTGVAVGVLCVLDRQPRELGPDQRTALHILGRQVITHLELRRNLRRLERSVAEHTRSEAARELAETRFRSLFEHVSLGIFQTTADGRYLAANTALARIYGYDSPEELRAAVQDIRGQLYVDPERRDEFIRLMREQGRLRHFESRVRRKDGTIIWISENAHAVYDADGQFLYYEGTVEDITEQKAAEEALRNSELLYHSLVESLPQNIFRKDREGRFTFVNQVFCQTLRRPAELILGRTDTDFFPPERAAQYRADDQQVMSTGRPLEKIEEHIKPDGTKLYVHVIKTPLQDANGQIIGVQGIFWDETERYRMEADLAYERDLLRALLDTVPDAIYFKDLNSRFIRASRALAEKFGCEDPGKLQGKTDFHFFTAEHALPAFEDEQRIILTGQPVLNKTEKETWPDGRVTWARTSKIPYRNRSGRIVGTIGVSKDITDLIQTERALEQARDDALQAARLKEAILANMSRELCRPLHAIIGTADLLWNSTLSGADRELALQIRDGATTLLGLLENILDQARLQAGQVQLELHDFNVREVIESAVELLALPANKKGLELTCWVHPDVPARLRGDPARLRQVLISLTDNAIKFTPRGEVQVRVGPVSARQDPVRLCFEVQDTGIGIPSERQASLFEPLRQGEEATASRQFGGGGLGLAIARDLVRLMGGEIQVQSQPGLGSTFSFEAEFRPASAPETETAAATELRGLRVLVVDDHAPSRRILLQTLRAWGVVADEAGDAEAALRQLREAAAAGTPWEVVLLDSTLGQNTSGLELAAAIQSDPPLPPPRVVLLSPPGEWPDAKALRARGVHECVLKPPRQSRLRAALTAQCHLAKGTRPNLPAAERPLQVVVAEASEPLRCLLAQQLHRLGHTVRVAANGHEALARLEQAPADVLLLDCQMPELDGYQTAQLWRERETARAARPGPPRPPLYIIGLTTPAVTDERERCLAAGMNELLTKPLRLEDLAAALQRGGRSTAPQPAEAPVIEEPVLDPSTLNALAGEAAVLAELCDLFMQTGRAQIERLKQAVRTGDRATLEVAANTLKGSALNFGARRLGRQAEALERLAHQVPVSEAVVRVAGLEAELEQVRQVLAAEPATHPG